MDSQTVLTVCRARGKTVETVSPATDANTRLKPGVNEMDGALFRVITCVSWF
jgi:hypothetical protein